MSDYEGGPHLEDWLAEEVFNTDYIPPEYVSRFEWLREKVEQNIQAWLETDDGYGNRLSWRGWGCGFNALSTEDTMRFEVLARHAQMELDMGKRMGWFNKDLEGRTAIGEIAANFPEKEGAGNESMTLTFHLDNIYTAVEVEGLAKLDALEVVSLVESVLEGLAESSSNEALYSLTDLVESENRATASELIANVIFLHRRARRSFNKDRRLGDQFDIVHSASSGNVRVYFED